MLVFRMRWAALWVVVCLIGAAALPAPARAQGDQLDADIRLFTVLAAINAAGYDQGLGAPGDHRVRRAVRRDLKNLDPDLRTRLENFYKEFEQDDAGRTLSQYVSFALLCGQPPEFELKAGLPTDLPPDVRPLRTFSPLLAEFYRKAEIEKLWSKYSAAYEKEITRYQEPLIQALFEAAGYLRFSPTSREVSSFKVMFDLLGAPNKINTRSYRGVVYVVVHPSEELRISEIRHSFLLHLLDPLSIRHAELIGNKEELARMALFAPALDQVYKTDFQLLVTKSLALAVEARLANKLPDGQREQVQAALRQGFILTPYFFEALAGYEQQGQEMKRYYPELIKGINAGREKARLQQTKFDERPAGAAEQAPARRKISGLDMTLREGEFFLASDELGKARKKFEEALDQSAGHPQALYGLARVAALDGDPDLAREYFQRVIESEKPDPHLLAMSHIFLGRIDDLMGNREEAVKHYQEALAAGDPSERTRQLAEKGLREGFQAPRGGEETSPEAGASE